MYPFLVFVSVSTSAVNYLERLFVEMTCYVLHAMLNPAYLGPLSLSHVHCFVSQSRLRGDCCHSQIRCVCALGVS